MSYFVTNKESLVPPGIRGLFDSIEYGFGSWSLGIAKNLGIIALGIFDWHNLGIIDPV